MRKLLPVAIVFAATFGSSSALAQSGSDRDAARENFKQADANKDGQLSRTEFEVFINANAEDGLGRAGMIRRIGAYDRAFARIDADKNGFVTPSEMSAARKD